MQVPFSPTANTIPYRDRASAGRWLANELKSSRLPENIAIFGMPRGGVPVATEVAREFRAPLDVFVVRKIFVDPERKRSIGALASGGVCVLNQDVLHTSEAEALAIAEAVAKVRDEVVEAERRYRGERPPLAAQGRAVVLIDDGAASGASLRAAIAALRSQGAGKIVVATPVASPEASTHLAREADDFVCPCVPDPFYSIGLAYERFPRIADETVSALLAQNDEQEKAYSAGDYREGR